MARWMSFITRSGEPVLINMDQAKHINPSPKDSTLSVIDGYPVQVSFQSLSLLLGAETIAAELALPEKLTE